MDLDEKKAEKRDTDNFKILRDDFVSGFRNFGCKAIEEIIAHEPALSEESRWWSDIKKYNSKNAPNSIIATDNKEIDTGSFDASGVAKWMLYMYTDGTLNTYLTGGCKAVSIKDCSPSAFNSALNSYMALRNYTAHAGPNEENLDTEDFLNLACLVCWLTAHLCCTAQQAALAHMRQVRDEIAEEIGRKIDPRDEYDIAFHQATPFPVGPWERPRNVQAIFPSQIGADFPRVYEHLCPDMPGAELAQGLLCDATGAYPPEELPEIDYASRQPFLKDIEFTRTNGGKTKKALDLLTKIIYYYTKITWTILFFFGSFVFGMLGARSSHCFMLVNLQDGQRDAIAHMFIDRCAHDLKNRRYQPLLAPGIAQTLIYWYLSLSKDPNFWLTRICRFVYDPLSWICFFVFAGLLLMDAVHAAQTYKKYRHLENTLGAAVYFYLVKMARIPGKLGFALGLMLIMSYFGNYPYLYPIMVTGWLAMQACCRMSDFAGDKN